MSAARRLSSHGARRATTRRRAALAAALLALGAAASAPAFENLNDAQTLVYDRPHLATTSTGDELVYRYSARVGDAPEVVDRATLSVEAESDAERRDVAVDFLDGERRLELPTFTAYRGNPILIATLEHFAQTLAASAGGGALYVRNRIRDGFAREGSSIERGTATYAGKPIDTTTLVLEPFVGDAYLGARAGYGDARLSIVFSDGVPGGVVSIEARSGASADTDAGAAPFRYALALEDAASG